MIFVKPGSRFPQDHIVAGTSHANHPLAESQFGGLVNWSKEIVDAVWQHGRVMPEVDAASWRQDACGAWIRREHFGQEHGEFGWKIEKVSAGAPDMPEFLRPFHCRNRYDVANSRPHCRETADRAGALAVEYVRPPRNREL